MNLSPVPTGWSAGMQKTITSTSERVSRTTSLSRRRSRLLGLCSPGVSTSTSCPPGRWTTPRMACRVVCGRLLTMPTFSPTIALVSVVLPALGRPTRQAKPLRWGGCSSGALTADSLPPTADDAGQPAVDDHAPGMIAAMGGRAGGGQDEPLAARAARERERHLQQVTSYGFLVRLGPKRSVTVTPAPLR